MPCVCRCRVAKDLEEKRSHYEPSHHDEGDQPSKLEEQDFVPHFQRVSISGEDTSGVSTAGQPIKARRSNPQTYQRPGLPPGRAVWNQPCNKPGPRTVLSGRGMRVEGAFKPGGAVGVWGPPKPSGPGWPR